MSAALALALIDAAAEVITRHEDELTSLDQAIGDGDHGANMRRGFQAIQAERDKLAAMMPGDALHHAGMILVMTVGGASGPLYGSLLMGMAKVAKTGGDLRDQLAEGIAMVKKRGKSDAGSKTMLDVLVPVLATLEKKEGHPPAEVIAAVRQVARDARVATRDVIATHGRASFLRERSLGHVDPGAASSQLLIDAIGDVLGTTLE